jgi:hypothetical protein
MDKNKKCPPLSAPTPPRVVCEGNRSELWNGVKERGLKRYKWVLADIHLLDL